jgi:uncharacterized membrane protein (UPF0127 family)
MAGFALPRPAGQPRPGWRLLALALLALSVAACASSSSAGGGSPGPATPSSSPTTGFASPAGPVANPRLTLPVGSLSIRRAGHTELSLEVQIAADNASRDTGLMGVTALPDTLGMAFLFGGNTGVAFWMQGTLIPLDIAFWDASGKIVSVATMQPCRSSTCTLYHASQPYVGAVEMDAGLLARHGVQAGDTVSLSA